jgi:PAS domain S-box-containing protein
MPKAGPALSRRNSLVWILRGEGGSAAPWVGYLLATLIVAIAFAVRLAILPVDGGFAFLTFYPAIALCALLFGAGPALLALALSTGLSEFILMPPYWSFALRSDQILPLAIYVASGAILCALAFELQRAAFELHESNEALRAINKRVLSSDTALRVTEQRLRTITNSVPAMIGYWNRELRCEFANDAYDEWFGLEAERILGMSLQEVLGDELFKLNEPYVLAALAGRPQQFERTIVKPDGSRGYTNASYVPDIDETGKVRGFFVLVVDVTPLRSSFERIRELAQRLETVREEERRSIANALHEGVAQELFALRLTVDELKSRCGGVAGVHEACDLLSAALARCLADTRQIASDLRPLTLAYRPLATSLAAHARYVGEKSGLAIEVRETAPLPALGEAEALLFFRAAQELLDNIVRHAQARTVEIELAAVGDRVLMRVRDDGKGIDTGALDKPGALGLLEIRERVAAQRGELMVQKAGDAGTVVTIALPIASIQPLAANSRR